MGMNSTISWTNHTFNPWRGCKMVHEGCTNCYAWRDSKRFPELRGIWGDAAGGGTRVKATLCTWKEPLRWNRKAEAAQVRARVFCASLADVFEDWDGQVIDHHGLPLWMSAAGDWIEAKATKPSGLNEFVPLTLDLLRRELFELIDATPWLDWLLLTKRPENIGRMWKPRELSWADADHPLDYRGNVWLGTSVSLQKHTPFLDELAKWRRFVPILFCSAEPLLGDLDLSRYLCVETDRPAPAHELEHGHPRRRSPWRKSSKFGFDPILQWVIGGGESGPGARGLHPRSISVLQEQCQAAGVPFHFKQWGEYLPVGANYPRCSDDQDYVIFDGARRSLVDFGYGDSIRFVKVGKEFAGNSLHGKQYLAVPEVNHACA